MMQSATLLLLLLLVSGVRSHGDGIVRARAGGALYRDGQFVGFEGDAATAAAAAAPPVRTDARRHGDAVRVAAPNVTAANLTANVTALGRGGGWVDVRGSAACSKNNSQNLGWWIGVFPASAPAPLHPTSPSSLPGNNSKSPFTPPFMVPAPLKFALVKCGVLLVARTVRTAHADRTPADASPRAFSPCLNLSHAHGVRTNAWFLPPLREATAFVLFSGGTARPVERARTAAIRFGAGPRYVRLARTNKTKQMRVSFTSGHGGGAIVEFGPAPCLAVGTTTTVAASSSTYLGSDLCGEPARTMGFYAPGLQHSAVLNLSEFMGGASIYYRASVDGVASQIFNFRVPAVGPTTTLRAVLTADCGATTKDRVSQHWAENDAFASHANMAARAPSADLAFVVGDLSYATGYLGKWETFMDSIGSFSSQLPVMVAQGNHEQDAPGTGTVDLGPETGRDSGGECGIPTASRFIMPGQADETAPTPGEQFFYSFDAGPVHFVTVNTELELASPKHAQFKWLEHDLAAVDRVQTPWVVVLGHRPMWPAPPHVHAKDNCTKDKSCSALEDLMYTHQVDLTVVGHVHYAQQSCPVYKGACRTPNATGGYDAPTHVVAGNGGQALNNASNKGFPSKTLPYVGTGCNWNAPGANCSASKHDGQGATGPTQGSGQEFGISVFEANATTLVWNFIGNNDSKTHHSFALRRAYPRLKSDDGTPPPAVPRVLPHCSCLWGHCACGSPCACPPPGRPEYNCSGWSPPYNCSCDQPNFRPTYPLSCPSGVDISGRPSRTCLPPWPPTYDMAASAITTLCNSTEKPPAWLDPDAFAPWGVVDVDWSNARSFWTKAQPMDCEEQLVTQAEKLKQRNPKVKAWVYRNLVIAEPWFSSVRDKLCDPLYAGWFLKTAPCRKPRLPQCDTNFSPPKCSEHWHDVGISPKECPGGKCDCGCVPCGQYLWDHRNQTLRNWLVEVHATGPHSVEHPAIDGLYIDDQWRVTGAQSSRSPECSPAGSPACIFPTEISNESIANVGLTLEQRVEMKGNWTLTMREMHAALLRKGGFAWSLFSPGSWNTLTADPVGGRSNCAANLRKRCVANDTLQHSAMYYDIARPLSLAGFLLVRGLGFTRMLKNDDSAALKPANATCACPAHCACLSAKRTDCPPPGTLTVGPTGANCTTIQGAIDLTRFGYRDRYTILIAPGLYKEKLVVAANRPPITLRGMSGVADGVLVQQFDCDGCSTPTDAEGEWYDQTLWVGASDFRAENISFAGAWPRGGRNMALQVAADRAAFFNSRFYGDSADTLYTGGMDHRAYFSNCYVNGTDDFIWGIGSAVFERSTLVGTSTITAHKGTQVDMNGQLNGCQGDKRFGESCTAWLFKDCRLPKPSPKTRAGLGSLGRPWRWMATVLFHSCWMDDHIPSAGWTLIKDSAACTPELCVAKNLTFAEFNSSGPGAKPTRPAPAKVFSAAEAASWTVERVLRGWNPLVPAQQPYCLDMKGIAGSGCKVGGGARKTDDADDVDEALQDLEASVNEVEEAANAVEAEVMQLAHFWQGVITLVISLVLGFVIAVAGSRVALMFADEEKYI